MKLCQLCLALILFVGTAFAQVDPPVGPLSTWTETRADMPDVIIVHRHGRQFQVTVDSEFSGEGFPLQMNGPTLVAMKWIDEPVDWPGTITVISDEVVHDGIVLVEVAGSAMVAAFYLKQMPEVLYAYPVEYTDPMFSRIVPTDRVIASLASGVTTNQIAAPYGLEVVTNMIGSASEYILRLVDPKSQSAADVVLDLENSGLVDWAMRDCLRDAEFYHTPTDARYANQWHLNAVGQTIGTLTAPIDVDVNAPAAWNVTRGAGSTVAVIDDAFETNHADLAANFTTSGAYDFYYNDTDPSPDGANDIHGTAVAGVVGAVENNTIGVVGIAHGSAIVPIKICGNGLLPYDSGVANSVRHAANYADIITCSWGYYNPAPVTRSAVQYALQSGAGGRGSVVFYAAGNDGGFIPHKATLGANTGNYQLRWRYSKDGSISAGLDKCFVDSIWYPGGGTEFFDGTTVPSLPALWSSGGSGVWNSAAETAGNRAESGSGSNWKFIESSPIGHSQSVYAQIANTVSTANSSLWYYMRVSAEPTSYSGNTATVFDYAQFEYQDPVTFQWTIANVQGGQPEALSYPAEYPETIAVGANDFTSRRSHYSQWSSHLDFVAPSDGSWAGLGIETTDRTGANGYDSGSYCQAATGSKFGGTSSATPLAAGIGALVRSSAVNAGLSPAQVRNVLRASCRKIGPTPSWYNYSGILGGRDSYMGWGQVDASNAVAIAAAEPPVAQIAFDLKITEVSPLDADCPFVEIYNRSANTYKLETLMLTDCETGGDEAESSFMFPQGMTVPAQSIMIVALGAATVGMINELNAVMSSVAAPPGGIQLFECIPSGLVGMPIGQMVPQGAAPGITLAASDNIALVVTPGMQASYLPDVVDGMSYGMPVVNPNCIIGAAPSIGEMGPVPLSATPVNSYQRNGVADSNVSVIDFVVAPRTPGWVAYGVSVSSFAADSLTSSAIELDVQPDPTIPVVMIAASLDPLFDYPVQGTVYPLMGSLGSDTIIYNGPVVPVPPIVDLPYPPNTPVYYRAWSVGAGNLYSAGTDASATTLPTPVPLPFGDNFPSATLNGSLWPYAPGVSIDAGTLTTPPPLPSPPYCAQLDNSNGVAQMASVGISATNAAVVKLTYWLMETGLGDPAEAGEFLEVQVMDPTLAWQTVATHPTMGPTPFMPFEVLIGSSLLHADFRVRFISRCTMSGAGDLDHWFVDSVTLEVFAVLSGFQWQLIPSALSSGIPFDVHLTALSSRGGVLTDYTGAPSLTLYMTNGVQSAAVNPNPAGAFVSGIWSNAITIAGEDALPVVLVADDGGVAGTSSVFRVYDDLDSDLMLDSWEFGWFGSINVASNSPATDWDHDLFPDYSEFLAGTVPTNPASLLQLTVPVVDAGVSNVLYWLSVSNRWYDVERTTNLPVSSWAVMVSNLPALPPTNYWVDTSSPSNRAFYRVKAKQSKAAKP